MNKKRFTTVILLLFLLLNTFTAFAQTNRGAANVKVKMTNGKTEEIKLYDASYALVIGNGKYTSGWDNLPGVASDVTAVKTVLENQGFTVETAENLASRDFSNRILQFIDDYGYEPNNRLLIYYAGHGHTLKSTGDGRDLGYVVPVDAPLPSKDELGFKRKAIPMDDILNFAKKIQSKHALFVFDSCFSGRLVSRGEIKVPPIIQESIAYPVRQFITAGAANQPVPDESIFRRSFVRALEGEADRNADGYITGTELAEYLKEKVTNYSNRQQTPQYGKINDIELDKGDFVFVIPKITADNSEKSSPVEREFWEAIKNSIDADDFRLYKQKYPNGIYTNLADLKIKQLTRDNADKSNSAEKKLDNVPETTSKTPAAAWSNFSVTARDLLKFDFVFPSSDGLAMVNLGGYPGKWGFIDKSGREVILLKYDAAGSFSEGLAYIKIGGKWGFIDKTGREVIPPKYNYANSFSYGLAPVQIGEKWGFIDKTGREVIVPKYVEAGSFSEDLAPVKLGGKWGFIDKTGREVISPTFDITGSFTEGLAEVLIGDYQTGKWGFIDKTGRKIIPLKFDYAGPFSEGLASVQIGKKWGFIDKTGREVIPSKFDNTTSFIKGLAMVNLGGKWGFIDKIGREIIPIKYNSIWYGSFGNEGFFGVVLNGKKGFVDLYGNEYFDF